VHLGHQVEDVLDHEAGEDVDGPAALRVRHDDLEVGGGEAPRPVAGLDHDPLERERLARHVDGAAVAAEVADVGVGVVRDEPAVPDRAEQRAEREERVHPGAGEPGQHVADRVDERVDRGLAAFGEPALQVARLVHDQRPAAVIGDPHARGAVVERDVAVEQGVAAEAGADRDMPGAAQEPAQARRPRRAPGVPCEDRRVASGMERPDPPALEEHVDHRRPGGVDRDAVVVDQRVNGAWNRCEQAGFTSHAISGIAPGEHPASQ
jgi:hypothetical protein